MVKLAMGGLVLLLAVPSGAAAQELDKAVLEKLKASTVFVVVESALGRGSGSGFLFLKRGTAGYIITCEHVVRGSETARIVFGSGTAAERAFNGQVLATDSDRDLACVLLKDAKDLPAPLDVLQKTDVTETESVYAAGFPFGRLLAAGEKNPEISISKSSVSSIRRDAEGRMAAVQLSGDVNPGNSGGPVVNSKGKVVGVTQSKVLGTSTAFAVPPEQIQGFLKGRVRSSSFTRASVTAQTAKVEVSIGLIDPLGTLKGVGIAWGPSKLFTADPKPEKDGTWLKAHASMKTGTLRIEEDQAVGALELSRGGASEPKDQTFLMQVSFVTSDGKTHWTEPCPLDIEFAAAAAPAGKADPPAAPGVPLPPVKAIDVPVGDEVKVNATLRLRAVISDLVLSPDGGSLFALDLSEGKVYRLNPDTLEIVAQADVMENAVAMCLTPDGRTIYVGGRDPNQQKPGGAIQTIPVSGFKPTGTFSIPFALHDLVATNTGTIIATGIGQWGGLAVIEASKKNVSSTCHRIYGGSHIRLHPDQTRVYTGDMGLSPGDFYCVGFTKKNPQNQVEAYDSPYHGDYPLGGDFEITPDGKFILGCYGTVLRLGKVKDADLKFAAKIDRGVSIAVARGSNTFLVSTVEGFLKVYDLQSFELKKSVKVNQLLSRVVLDPSKGRLFAVASQPPTDRSGYVDPRALPAGDIVNLSLSGK